MADGNAITDARQVLESWQPPRFGARPKLTDSSIGGGWRRTGRGNHACTAPFKSELVIYERRRPYRCWRAVLNQTAGLKRVLPEIDWRIARRSPGTYDNPRQAAARAWPDILDGLDRVTGGFDPDDWEIVP